MVLEEEQKREAERERIRLAVEMGETASVFGELRPVTVEEKRELLEFFEKQRMESQRRIRILLETYNLVSVAESRGLGRDEDKDSSGIDGDDGMVAAVAAAAAAAAATAAKREVAIEGGHDQEEETRRVEAELILAKAEGLMPAGEDVQSLVAPIQWRQSQDQGQAESSGSLVPTGTTFLDMTRQLPAPPTPSSWMLQIDSGLGDSPSRRSAKRTGAKGAGRVKSKRQSKRRRAPPGARGPMLPEPGEKEAKMEGKEMEDGDGQEAKAKEAEEQSSLRGEAKEGEDRDESKGERYASVAFAKVPGKGGEEDVFHVLCLVSPNKMTIWRRGKLVRIIFDSTPSIKGNVVIELYRGDLPIDETGQIP